MMSSDQLLALDSEITHHAKIREEQKLKLIQSRNLLATYTPHVLLYVIASFAVSIIVAYNSLCLPLSFSFHWPPICIPREQYSKVVVDDTYESFHYFTAGAFASTFALVLVELIDGGSQTRHLRAQLKCTAFVQFASFWCHISIAQNWLPPVVNAFGRLACIQRLIEWFSLIPILVFMMHSIDVRTDNEFLYMWVFAGIQQLSVFCGSLGLTSSRWEWSIFFISIAVLLFLSAYTNVHFAFLRLQRVVLEESIADDDSENNVLNNDSDAPNSPDNRDTETRLDPMKVSEILSRAENVGVRISYLLSVYAAISWTTLPLTAILSLFGLFDHNVESCCFAALDFMSKCFYVQVVCYSHNAALSPEGILVRLILFEEKANAAIRQSIRFVFHELSNPLNSLAIGLDSLQEQKLSHEGLESLTIAKSNCNLILETLRDVRHFQSLEQNVSVDLRMRAFNLKALIRETALSLRVSAREVGVSLILSIDSRIPELLMGDKMRLKQVICCFISHSITMASACKSACTIRAIPIDEINGTDSSTFAVRFAVKYEGNEMSLMDIRSLSARHSFSISNAQSSSSPIALQPFKRIIEAHGGTLGFETASRNGTSYFFDIPYKVVDEAEPRIEVLNNKSTAVGMRLAAMALHRAKEVEIPTKVSPPPDVTAPATKIAMKGLSPQFVPNKISSNKVNENISLDTSKKAFTAVGGKSSSPPRRASQHSHDSNTPFVALVVDDVLSNRMMTGRVLELMGFTVDFAEDGDIAIEMVKAKIGRQEFYDAIIMDNVMPNMTGKEATGALRAMNYNGLIIGLTGNVLDEDLEEFRESGCDEVITKPLDVPELRRTLISLGMKISKG